MTTPGPAKPPPRAPMLWADLGPRLISSAVLVAIIATGLYFGGYVWAVLAAVVFAMTYREWEQMVTLRPIGPLGMVLGGLLAIAALAYPAFGPLATLGVAAIAVVVSLFGENVVRVWRVGGLIFFAIVLIAVQELRGTVPAGIVAGWFLGIVIAFNDAGAYFVGRMIGGPKLAPMISPAKTVSGSVGGWLLGTLAGAVYWVTFTPSPWWVGLLLSAALGVVGQTGDLLESAIKRLFRVKDSGDIIPGHGGFMDRFDAVTGAVLATMLIGLLTALPAVN